jgi:glycosyltransferase involved in cell wall biosynthesis
MERMLVRPGTALTQSLESERRLLQAGWKCSFVPNGVDTLRFTPALAEEKSKIRIAKGVPSDKRILLHLGPVKRARNVDWLVDLVSNDTYVLVVSRPSDLGDPGLIQHIRKSGIFVWTDFQSSIQDIYRMSDVYVFPAT